MPGWGVWRRRSWALAVAAATGVGGAAAAAAGAAAAPTPPEAVRLVLADPRLVLSMPAGGGAWTVWSGRVGGAAWFAVSAPRARQVAAGPCPPRAPALTVCLRGAVLPGRNVVVGRARPRVARIEARDGRGRRLRAVLRGGAYLVVAGGTGPRITVVARDGDGDVVARRTVRT